MEFVVGSELQQSEGRFSVLVGGSSFRFLSYHRLSPCSRLSLDHHAVDAAGKRRLDDGRRRRSRREELFAGKTQ